MSTKTKNYYEILGIDKAAAADDIKKAYRELSKQHHPDKGGDAEKFKEISEAYSVLSNPDKRKDYDNPMRGNPFSGFDPFGDIFNFTANRNRRQYRPDPNAPKRGRNIQMEQEAPLHLFILGGSIQIQFYFDDVCVECSGRGGKEFETCDECKGTGQITQVQSSRGMHIQSTRPCPSCMGRGITVKDKCEACNGVGKLKSNREVTLPIPAGLRDGQPVGAAGQGGHGVNGGPAGDLIVKMVMKYPKPEELTDEQKKVLEEI